MEIGNASSVKLNPTIRDRQFFLRSALKRGLVMVGLTTMIPILSLVSRPLVVVALVILYPL